MLKGRRRSLPLVPPPQSLPRYGRGRGKERRR
jgi:hypothetical protein